jgi:hypothetical protein
VVGCHRSRYVLNTKKNAVVGWKYTGIFVARIREYIVTAIGEIVTEKQGRQSISLPKKISQESLISGTPGDGNE